MSRLRFYVQLPAKIALGYVPMALAMNQRRGYSGGTASARYCYSVWLRHLVLADKNGFPAEPETVAELGPGFSLGMGLAALISGAKKYYALDIVPRADIQRNLRVFDELIELFSRREKIPGPDEFHEITPEVESLDFPDRILTPERLSRGLDPAKLESIRDVLKNPGAERDSDVRISYIVPWNDPGVIRENSVDWVFSHNVLEHVDDLDNTYKSLFLWLKPGGFMTITIGYHSHSITPEWNGYWKYSDFFWNLRRGKRPYFINRQPQSVHIDLIRKSGFTIASDMKHSRNSEIKRNQLAPRFRNLSDEDLTTDVSFILAVKK